MAAAAGAEPRAVSAAVLGRATVPRGWPQPTRIAHYVVLLEVCAAMTMQPGFLSTLNQITR